MTINEQLLNEYYGSFGERSRAALDERAESPERLPILEPGCPMTAAVARVKGGQSVDTPDDLENVRAIFREMEKE
ncbi:hypothetical protein [Aminivibrio sp.]|jgi:CMP-2-keto-3-deoxyoctulosonic acid synthetase|uniref:hypothetical protein n=1 Tax=Aminivibrio sp. TaxID=1872489 RepID=UPI001A39ADFD|nr:hypothetical protein [Aminivibrio sp.]MBL3540417.1 hypothetical protein [Aminivibrio sp.]MDK2959441.1 hypothetical protein [Synergistaceae bacterium]